MTEKIITLNFPKDTETVLELVKPSIFSGCQHNLFLIDERLDTVTCRDCGEKINPMFALKKLAEKESNYRKKLQEITDFYHTQKKLNSILMDSHKYKCKHCGKFNQAILDTKWNGEVRKVDFTKVEN